MYRNQYLHILQNILTLVLTFFSDFFNERTTNGSALPMKSTTGKSSAEITVTDKTPLTITLFLLRDEDRDDSRDDGLDDDRDDDIEISSSSKSLDPLLRVFSNVVKV